MWSADSVPVTAGTGRLYRSTYLFILIAMFVWNFNETVNCIVFEVAMEAVLNYHPVQLKQSSSS